MEVLFLALGGIVILFFFAGGLAFLFTDLSGMFCYYKSGGIYLVRRDKRLAEDTPQNRRKVSRYMGLFVLSIDIMCCLDLLILAAQMI